MLGGELSGRRGDIPAADRIRRGFQLPQLGGLGVLPDPDGSHGHGHQARAGVAIALVARMSRIVVEVASVHLEAP